jgi:hypothetical protein
MREDVDLLTSTIRSRLGFRHRSRGFRLTEVFLPNTPKGCKFTTFLRVLRLASGYVVVVKSGGMAKNRGGVSHVRSLVAAFQAESSDCRADFDVWRIDCGDE